MKVMGPTMTSQRLSTGLLIRQDFRSSVRFVLYETGDPDFAYATHGGTLFVVNVQGRVFGVTCGHVRNDFAWRDLVVTDAKFGRQVAGLKAVYSPAAPEGEAVDSQVMDLIAVEFTPDVTPAFFGDTAYVFDAGTISSSVTGDQLVVNGAFKAESVILDAEIAPTFGLVEFQDAGLFRTDLTLRRAIGRYHDPSFAGLTGLSGSPVFNRTQGRLAGVMARGGLNGDEATMYYIDVVHLETLLMAIVSGADRVSYTVHASL